MASACFDRLKLVGQSGSLLRLEVVSHGLESVCCKGSDRPSSVPDAGVMPSYPLEVWAGKGWLPGAARNEASRAASCSSLLCYAYKGCD